MGFFWLWKTKDKDDELYSKTKFNSQWKPLLKAFDNSPAVPVWTNPNDISGYELHETLIDDDSTEVNISNINRKVLDAECIKNAITRILKESKITKLDEGVLTTKSKVVKCVNDLIKEWKIDEKIWRNILYSTQMCKVWEYLIEKWYFTEKELEVAEKIQQLKSNKWKLFIEVLINTYPKRRSKLIITLLELWLMKLWEALLYSWNIKEKKPWDAKKQLNECLELQRFRPNDNIWLILLEKWYITKIGLDQVTDMLWLDKKEDDYDINKLTLMSTEKSKKEGLI